MPKLQAQYYLVGVKFKKLLVETHNFSGDIFLGKVIDHNGAKRVHKIEITIRHLT